MKLPNNNYFIFNKSQIILRLNMPHNRPNIHYIKRYIIYVFFSYIYWSRKICHVCAYINHFFILHNGINYSKKIPLHFILQRIKRTFSDYIYGKWKRSKDGYTSCLYVDFNGKIEQDCTITTVLSSKVEFHVPKGSVCKLYVGGESTVHIDGKGVCYVYSYGHNDVTGRFKSMNCITKSEWVK